MLKQYICIENGSGEFGRKEKVLKKGSGEMGKLVR